MRYKITIEYDGTNLLGWQKQTEGFTVQGYVESAIEKFSHKTVEIVGAGRTDTGVHATHQVAHFDLDTTLSPFRIMGAINAHLQNLKAPVSILEIQEVDDDFHARFSAIMRGYIYKISNRRSPLILDNKRKWQVGYPLDIEKMQIGANYLIGQHDFSSFRGAGCQALSPIKSIENITINKTGDDIDIIIVAKSFLYHQVRNIVGTLKAVGEGRFTPEDIKTILENKDRTKAGATAPAHGLYLNKVEY